MRATLEVAICDLKFFNRARLRHVSPSWDGTAGFGIGADGLT